MPDNGSETLVDIAAMVGQRESVDLRVALARDEDGWQVRHGRVILHAETALTSRAWRYADEVFLDRRLPGALVAGLLRAEPQMVDGLKVTAPATVGSGSFERVAGQADWRPAQTPWPRTQWRLDGGQTGTSRPSGLRVGEGPSFVSYEAAFNSFFNPLRPRNEANQQPLWWILQLDRRAWLHQVTITTDAMTVVVKGTQLDGVSLELNTPSGPGTSVARSVGRTGRIRMRLPNGLTHGTLLVLRRGTEWIDYRYFATSGPIGEHDPSIVWVQPEAELALLLAGGESQHIEFKERVPVGEGGKKDSSRHTVLKTVAAFASGEGGTVLFGVDDDAQVVGLDSAPSTLDGLKLALTNMIRNSITPEPEYTLREAQFEGKTLLLLHVKAGTGWYALYPTKPEFYVRRGASTPPAHMDEIASGFGQPQPHRQW